MSNKIYDSKFEAYCVFALALKHELGADEYGLGSDGYRVQYISNDKKIQIVCRNKVENPFVIKIINNKRLEYVDMPMNSDEMNELIVRLKKMTNKGW